MNFAYTYDSRGNITSETRNGVTTTYECDALGQLIRVNDPNDPTAHNEGALSDNGTTWIYVYDRGGNILSKTAYEFTTGAVGTAVRTWLYEYDTDWKDKLSEFDVNTIEYDAIGNPTNDGTWEYAWQAGRQLGSMSKGSGSNAVLVEFTYNHAGLRTKKVVTTGEATETTEYILNGKNVAALIKTTVTTGASPTTTTDRLHFYYDAQGRVALVNFNGTLYSYANNLQGDIIGILDSSGNLVVEYKYDAWGRSISVTGTLTTTLGELNPFRYRGYVWDQETELYYLRSRYFNPYLNRFSCADTLLDKNLYHYCQSNPINRVDPDGQFMADYYAYDSSCYNVREVAQYYGCFTQPTSSSTPAKRNTGYKAQKRTVTAYATVFDVTAGYELTYMYGTCKDTYGNEAVFETVVGVNPAGPDNDLYVGLGLLGISYAYVIQTISVDSVKEIAGTGCYIGGSISVGASIGVDAIFLNKTIPELSKNDTPDGYQISIGIGYGDTLVHIGNAYTRIMLIKENGNPVPEKDRVWYYGK